MAKFGLANPDELAILQELSDSFVVDLRNYLPLGPVINLGLYNIPPQPKKVKQWVIKESEIRLDLNSTLLSIRNRETE
jgi:hypothetical protein